MKTSNICIKSNADWLSEPGLVTSRLKAFHNSSVTVISQTHKWAQAQNYLIVPQHTTAIVLCDDGQWLCLYILNVNGKMIIHNQYLVFGILQTPIIPHLNRYHLCPLGFEWPVIPMYYFLHISHTSCVWGRGCFVMRGDKNRSIHAKTRQAPTEKTSNEEWWLTDWLTNWGLTWASFVPNKKKGGGRVRVL